ncbi:hypothetical protein HK096_007697 [Nowakowskiella sp. JEL0078]|nr:hypothetical protein HK096_007697 [Nowakowskiella sp. JEL0078]
MKDRNGLWSVLDWCLDNGILAKAIESEDGWELIRSMDSAFKTVLFKGDVDTLEWWKSKSGLDLDFLVLRQQGLDKASLFGHIEVLQWVLMNVIDFKWTINSMDNASEYGHVKVLVWWKNSGLQMLYSGSTFFQAIRAVKKGNFEVTIWWLGQWMEKL